MDIDEPHEADRRVVVFENGKFRPGATGTTVYINALQTLPGFLKSAGERLGGLHAQRLFNADGNEVDDLMLVDDGDMLFVSCGEDFQPYHHNGNGRRAGDGSDGGRSHGAGYGKSGAGRIDHIGGYRLVAYLGRGAYGRVYKGVHQLTEQPVAIKFISKLSMGNVGDAERISTEIHCLETLHHRSVIKLYQVLNTDRAVALVFEYAGGGDLRQKVKTARRLPEAEAARLFASIMDGVIYCHRRHIVHHDLKLENILLDDEGSAKIADFGLSRVYRPGSTSTSTAGSLAYIAPEVLKDGATAGPPRDVWSLGVILYAMVCGRLPFEHQNRSKLVRRIITGSYGYDSPSVASKACRDLIGALLTVDPESRATLPSLRLHPWIVRHRRAATTHMFTTPMMLIDSDDESDGRSYGDDDDEADSTSPRADEAGTGGSARSKRRRRRRRGRGNANNDGDGAGGEGTGEEPLSPNTARRRARANSHGILGRRGRTNSRGKPPPSTPDGSATRGADAATAGTGAAGGDAARPAVGWGKQGGTQDGEAGAGGGDGAGSDGGGDEVGAGSGRRHRAAHLVPSSLRMRKGGVWGDGWAAGGANRTTPKGAHPGHGHGDGSGSEDLGGAHDAGGSGATPPRHGSQRGRERGGDGVATVTTAVLAGSLIDDGASVGSRGSHGHRRAAKGGNPLLQQRQRDSAERAGHGSKGSLLGDDRYRGITSSSHSHHYVDGEGGNTPGSARSLRGMLADDGSARPGSEALDDGTDDGLTQGGDGDDAAVLSGSIDPASGQHRGSFRRRRLKRRVVLSSLPGSILPGAQHSNSRGSNHGDHGEAGGGSRHSNGLVAGDLAGDWSPAHSARSVGRARPYTAAAVPGSGSLRGTPGTSRSAGPYSLNRQHITGDSPSSASSNGGSTGGSAAAAKARLRYLDVDGTGSGSDGTPVPVRRLMTASGTRGRAGPTPGARLGMGAAGRSGVGGGMVPSPHSPANQPYRSGASFFNEHANGAAAAATGAAPSTASSTASPASGGVRRTQHRRRSSLSRHMVLGSAHIARQRWRIAILAVRAAVRWVRIWKSATQLRRAGGSTGGGAPLGLGLQFPFAHMGGTGDTADAAAVATAAAAANDAAPGAPQNADTSTPRRGGAHGTMWAHGVAPAHSGSSRRPPLRRSMTQSALNGVPMHAKSPATAAAGGAPLGSSIMGSGRRSARSNSGASTASSEDPSAAVRVGVTADAAPADAGGAGGSGMRRSVSTHAALGRRGSHTEPDGAAAPHPIVDTSRHGDHSWGAPLAADGVAARKSSSTSVQARDEVGSDTGDAASSRLPVPRAMASPQVAAAPQARRAGTGDSRRTSTRLEPLGTPRAGSALGPIASPKQPSTSPLSTLPLDGDDGSTDVAARRWRRARVMITAVVRFGRGNVYAQPQHMRAVEHARAVANGGAGGTSGVEAMGVVGSNSPTHASRSRRTHAHGRTTRDARAVGHVHAGPTAAGRRTLAPVGSEPGDKPMRVKGRSSGKKGRRRRHSVKAGAASRRVSKSHHGHHGHHGHHRDDSSSNAHPSEAHAGAGQGLAISTGAGGTTSKSHRHVRKRKTRKRPKPLAIEGTHEGVLLASPDRGSPSSRRSGGGGGGGGVVLARPRQAAAKSTVGASGASSGQLLHSPLVHSAASSASGRKFFDDGVADQGSDGAGAGTPSPLHTLSHAVATSPVGSPASSTAGSTASSVPMVVGVGRVSPAKRTSPLSAAARGTAHTTTSLARSAPAPTNSAGSTPRMRLASPDVLRTDLSPEVVLAHAAVHAHLLGNERDSDDEADA